MSLAVHWQRIPPEWRGRIVHASLAAVAAGSIVLFGDLVTNAQRYVPKPPPYPHDPPPGNRTYGHRYDGRAQGQNHWKRRE